MLNEYEAKKLEIEMQNSRIEQLKFARSTMYELHKVGILSRTEYCRFLTVIAGELGFNINESIDIEEDEED